MGHRVAPKSLADLGNPSFISVIALLDVQRGLLPSSRLRLE
jgi:hypothetical protein